MKCQPTDKLSQYVDDLLLEEEMIEIKEHIEKCSECNRIVKAFENEQQYIKETLQTPALPDDFASSIVDQLEPYEQPPIQKKKPIWKRRILPTAAGVLLAVGLSISLTPAFAEWIGGLFQSDQVDEGLRMATEAGFVNRIDKEVTDNGLTLKVEDVVADSSRVALSYQVLNENGKPQDTYLDMADSENEIYAITSDGKRIENFGLGWQDKSDYGLMEFSLREQEALEKMTVKMNITELKGVKGNWQLDIPVDLKESMKYTTTVPLNDATFSEHGVQVKMKKILFSPSSNELFYETGFTEEEEKKVEEKIRAFEEKYGEEVVHSFWGYGSALEYHIENEEQETIYSRGESSREPSSGAEGMLQGTGEDLGKFGTAWSELFIPQKEKEQLTFVLDGIAKTEPADFSITFKPEELKDEPVSFEYEGNVVTIKQAKMKGEYSVQKSLMPIHREKVFTIEMKGGKEPLSALLGTWVLVDDKGNSFVTLESGSTFFDKDEQGLYKTETTLRTYNMDEVPDEVTLHLLSATHYYELENKWRVPLQ